MKEGWLLDDGCISHDLSASLNVTCVQHGFQRILKPSDFTPWHWPKVFEQRAVLRRLLPGGRPTVDGPPDAADALLGLLSWLGHERSGTARLRMEDEKMEKYGIILSYYHIMTI